MRSVEQPQPEGRHAALPVRVLLFLAGSLSLALGVVGVFLPLLPTTPFVLLAAGCYMRASPAAYQWLRANRYFGPICRSGTEGRYLPPRAKAFAVGITLLSFAASIVLIANWPVRIVLVALGLAVTTWLIRLPTQPRGAPDRAA